VWETQSLWLRQPGPGMRDQDRTPALFPLANQTSLFAHLQGFGSIMGRMELGVLRHGITRAAAMAAATRCHGLPRQAFWTKLHCSALTLRLISSVPLNPRRGAPGCRMCLIEPRPCYRQGHCQYSLPYPFPSPGSGPDQVATADHRLPAMRLSHGTLLPSCFGRS